MDFSLLSLDLETSSSDISNGTILSIGLVFYLARNHFYRDVKHYNLMLSPEAMRINKIDVLNLDSEDKLTLEELDEELAKWLVLFSHGKMIPMGFNVGSFDMLFVRKYLPKVSKYFSYRSCDLNSLIFAKAIKEDKNFVELKNEIKSKVIGQVEETVLRINKEWAFKHNALFDAYFNCLVLEELLK